MAHLDRYAQEIAHHADSGAPSIIVAPWSIDAWTHERLYAPALPILRARPGSEWLSVGDGGGDAWWLREQGAVATASCITTAHLEKLADLLAGIPVLELNAEAIDLPDGSTDFILCKESFHHFPRAMLAFYEFMRVARCGVLLIEPADFGADRPLDLLRSLVKRVLRRQSFAAQAFEPVGNYIYKVSIRETLRALTALQTPWFAVKPLNSFFAGNLHGRRRDNWLFATVFRLGVATQDLLARLGLMRPGLAAVFVPTGAVDLREDLRRAGYRIVETARNPYRSS